MAKRIGWIAACLTLSLAAPLSAQTAWRTAVSPERASPSASSESVEPAAWQQPLAEPENPLDAPMAAPANRPPTPTAISRGQHESPLSLPRPSRVLDTVGKASGGLPSLLTVAASLAIVLGLFFAVVWFLKRGSPKSNLLLPQEVVEVLGRAPLDGRQQLHLLRCGRKLLLVSVTPAGAETLTEITDPLEVDRLAGLCMQTRPNSATSVFRQVFQQFADQHETVGVGVGGQEAHHG